MLNHDNPNTLSEDNELIGHIPLQIVHYMRKFLQESWKSHVNISSMVTQTPQYHDLKKIESIGLFKVDFHKSFNKTITILYHSFGIKAQIF